MIAFRPFCQVACEKAVDDTDRSFAEVRCVSFVTSVLSTELRLLSMERKKPMVFDLLDESFQ